MIQEVIIVEGKDDEAAVKKAVDAEVIITHGFGITKETYNRIETAYKNKGIIIFTDPDHAGENIRKRLSERFPNSKHAFLSRGEATKNADIGIENASEENIIKALKKSRAKSSEKRFEFSMEDLINNGLSGNLNSAQKRDVLGTYLGIGYGNAKTFLKRLNNYNITREEFEKAVKTL